MRSGKDTEDTVSERTGPYRTAMVRRYGRQQRLPSPAKTRQLDVNLVIFSESFWTIWGLIDGLKYVQDAALSQTQHRLSGLQRQKRPGRLVLRPGDYSETQAQWDLDSGA